MPQSSKDAKGGKTHAKKDTHASGGASAAAQRKAASKPSGSPTGPQKHGEKKTTN
ncbi:hypothetical protein [uncultured Ramlibacter sp.]|uniref:hypothetical protein n=1 Tax=uncultured Ramlibacter sp. TaxID=260755 RepID=UPI002634354A|nr:hypothetical protein [uncultured Ramlibacter sp.]